MLNLLPPFIKLLSAFACGGGVAGEPEVPYYLEEPKLLRQIDTAVLRINQSEAIL